MWPEIVSAFESLPGHFGPPFSFKFASLFLPFSISDEIVRRVLVPYLFMYIIHCYTRTVTVINSIQTWNHDFSTPNLISFNEKGNLTIILTDLWEVWVADRIHIL